MNKPTLYALPPSIMVGNDPDAMRYAFYDLGAVLTFRRDGTEDRVLFALHMPEPYKRCDWADLPADVADRMGAALPC